MSHPHCEKTCTAFGVDLTQVPGVHTLTIQILLTEIGPDFSRFPTSGDFGSWLRICPNPKITGGKVISSKTRSSRNRAALAVRIAAQGLHRSQSFLGNYFRRMKARLGTPKAITAVAHKLPRIVYHMVTRRRLHRQPPSPATSAPRGITSAAFPRSSAE